MANLDTMAAWLGLTESELFWWVVDAASNLAGDPQQQAAVDALHAGLDLLRMMVEEEPEGTWLIQLRGHLLGRVWYEHRVAFAKRFVVMQARLALGYYSEARNPEFFQPGQLPSAWVAAEAYYRHTVQHYGPPMT